MVEMRGAKGAAEGKVDLAALHRQTHNDSLTHIVESRTFESPAASVKAQRPGQPYALSSGSAVHHPARGHTVHTPVYVGIQKHTHTKANLAQNVVHAGFYSYSCLAKQSTCPAKNTSTIMQQ